MSKDKRSFSICQKTGENDWKPVVKLFRNETKAWHHIFVDGEEIVCTGGHPFYVVSKGFVEAKDLKISDKLLLSDGRCVTIEKIEVETLEKAEITYNFEIEDFHTYYVSETNVLVHNVCRGAQRRRSWKQIFRYFMELNMDYIEVLKNFVSGVISIEEFKNIYFSDEKLQQFLQDNLPESMVDYADIRWNNGDFNMAIRKKRWGTKFGNYGVQSYIELWLKRNNIDCYVTPIYDEQLSFLLSVIPDYINGIQAESLIEDIIQSVPETMPKTKRIKEIKAKIKEAFHLQDRKYPRWAQDTDWPFSKTGKPLKYVSRKTDGDLVQHAFVDVDTGEKTIVEEFY